MANSTSTHDGIRLFLDDLDRYPLPDHEEQVELAKRVAAGDDEARRADDRGQPPPGGPLGAPVPGPRRRLRRPRPGGDLRPDARRRQVRLAARLPLLHLRHVVDPPSPATRRRSSTATRSASPWRSPSRPSGPTASPGSSPPTSSAIPPPRRSPRPAGSTVAPSRRCRARRASWPASTSRPAPTAAPHSATSSAPTSRPSRTTSNGRWCSVGSATPSTPSGELERDVLRIRYGLDDGTPTSLQATASRLGIGVRRARQAEARALQQLADAGRGRSRPPGGLIPEGPGQRDQAGEHAGRGPRGAAPPRWPCPPTGGRATGGRRGGTAGPAPSRP